MTAFRFGRRNVCCWHKSDSDSDHLFRLSSFWHPPRIAGVHRGLDWRFRRRNSLVVEYAEGVLTPRRARVRARVMGSY